MSKIMILSPPLWGHISPLIAVAVELIGKGHQILLLDYFEEEFPFKKPITTRKIKNSFKQEIKNSHEKGHNKYHLIYPLRIFFEQILNETCSVIDSFNPDLILSDSLFTLGGIIAEERNIPYIFSHSNPYIFIRNLKEKKLPLFYRIIENKTEEFFNKFMAEKLPGSDKLSLFPFSPYMNICFATQRFVGKENISKNGLFSSPFSNDSYKIEFTGPSILSKDSDKNDLMVENILLKSNAKKILISFGSLGIHEGTNNYLNLIRTIIQACNSNEYLLFLCFPDSFVKKALENITLIAEVYSDNFININYLIKHFNLFISHGGYNSLMESISNEVPVICIPHAYDQRRMSDLVKAHLLGDTISPNHYSLNEIIEKTRGVISSKKIRNSLKLHKESINNSPGNILSSNIINKFVS